MDNQDDKVKLVLNIANICVLIYLGILLGWESVKRGD